METTTQPLPEISGGAPLYRRPEPLNPTDHGKLGLLASPVPYAFAANQHFVPLLMSEFGPAACSYPVIFAGEERAPIAVMGLKPGENLYAPDVINRGEAYNPAYIRRYPFIVATSADPGNTAAVVCIDRDSDLIGENPVQPFFTADGQFSDYATQCVSFCQNYENDRAQTISAIARLRELDLFEFRTVSFTPTDAAGKALPPVEVAGFHAISADKLNQLPIETFIKLRDQGLLTAIIAHWVSQSQWDRIVSRAIRRDNEQAAAAAAEAPAKKSAADAKPKAPPKPTSSKKA